MIPYKFSPFSAAHGFPEDGEGIPLITIDDNNDDLTSQEEFPEALPVLALKNTVLFPNIVIPITVGRDRSIRTINKAHEEGRLVAVLSQRDSAVEDPNQPDLYEIGTIARIIKILRMPDGTMTAILQGRRRFRLTEWLTEQPILSGSVLPLDYELPKDDIEFRATIDSVRDLARNIVELSPNLPSEAAMMLTNITSDSFLLNFIASNLNSKTADKQLLLAEDRLQEKADAILQALHKELQVLEVRDQIENKVRGDIEEQQRNYFLNQQLKTIQKELGQNPQEEEVGKLTARAAEKEWPEEVAKTFEREVERLRRMNPQVAEYSVQLSYLEMLLDLPWEETTPDNFDLSKVKKVLDDDHFGLDKVKERILEHLAVLKLKGDLKAPIILLVGPPGVGKTSLGKSVAQALGRKFVRMSLGGLHDESEIRGHRKTYIGAMPGRIIQSLKKVGSANPVFILDEIDKIGNSFRGDPASALLEVLDPEQNSTFHDNYLDLDFDLSRVLFIATANSLNSIQPALLDRMEVIQLSGYSQEEKLGIATKHLVPKQRKEHGLKNDQVKVSKSVLKSLIDGYTRESGVRSLDRRLAGLMRRAAKRVAMDGEKSVKFSPEDLNSALGPAPFGGERYQRIDVPGVAVGLAWTSVGGDILFVEASLSPGSGKLTLTGNLGDVMKESATTALSYLRAHGSELGIEPEEFKKQDVHLHVPEGAIPKDGPSAGITMLSALTSAFLQRPLKPFLAMTGEITLRGKVLPVGGIKEKMLAARRSGIKQIILSKENEKHVNEIEETYRKDLDFHYVSTMREVTDLALAKK